MNTSIKGCLLTGFLNTLLHLTAGLFNHFLDSCWMNTAIGNKLFQCDTCHLTANWIKTGKDNSLWGVINNQVNTSHGFKSANIATLTANDTALHFIVWQSNNGNRSLCHMISSTTLNCQRNDISCLLFSLILGLLLIFLNHYGLFMLQLFFHLCQQHVLGLFRRKTGNTLQLLLLLFMQLRNLSLALFQLGLPGSKVLLLLLQSINLAVKIFFLLNYTALMALNLGATLTSILIKLLTKTMDILLRLQQLHFLCCFTFFLSITNDTLCFFLSRTNLLLG